MVLREGYAAAAVRNNKGEVARAAVEKVSVASPLVGELEIAWLGVREVGRQDFRKVILECDSEQVIREVMDFPRSNEWRIRNMVSSLRQQFNLLQWWRAQHDKEDLTHQLAST